MPFPGKSTQPDSMWKYWTSYVSAPGTSFHSTSIIPIQSAVPVGWSGVTGTLPVPPVWAYANGTPASRSISPANVSTLMQVRNDMLEGVECKALVLGPTTRAWVSRDITRCSLPFHLSTQRVSVATGQVVSRPDSYRLPLDYHVHVR